MSKFTLIRQSNSKRCEICHQNDCFDSSNNRCNRCDKFSLNKLAKYRSLSNASLLKWMANYGKGQDNHKPAKIFSYVALSSWIFYCVGPIELGLELSFFFSFAGFFALLLGIFERKRVFHIMVATIVAVTPLIFSIVYLALISSQTDRKSTRLNSSH